MVRWSLVVVAGVALAACSKNEAAPVPKVAEGPEHVDCALGPGTSFARDCAIERSREGGVYKMVIRHPDGGFRRFEVDKDNAIVSSDGADAAQVAVDGTVAEVTVGNDRYRIPLEAAPASDAAKP